MAASSPSIPVEIWLHIARFVDSKDMGQLVLVSRRFRAIFSQPLYTELTVNFANSRLSSTILKAVQSVTSGDSPRQSIFGRLKSKLTYKRPTSAGTGESSKFAFADFTNPHCGLLLSQLDASDILRGHVREISLVGLNKGNVLSPQYKNLPESTYDEFVEKVINLLTRLPRVEVITFNGATLPIRSLLRIASSPNAPHEIYLKDIVIYGSATDDMKETLNPLSKAEPTSEEGEKDKIKVRVLCISGRVTWSDWSILYLFFASPSIKTLYMPQAPMGTLLEQFLNIGRPSMVGLTSIQLENVSVPQLVFLRAMPNLRRLYISHLAKLQGIGAEDLPTDGPERIFPQLRHFSGHHSDLPAVLAGRKVNSIESEDIDSDSRFDLTTKVRNFGSATSVTRLVWKKCTRYDEILKYLWSFAPSIQSLTLGKSSSDETFDSVSQMLRRLRRLRKLSITLRTGAPTKEILDQEYKYCISLVTGGNRDLISLSFSTDINWIRHPDDDRTAWTPRASGSQATSVSAVVASEWERTDV